MLRIVPDGLREASLALGTPEWRTVTGVVLPTARAGLITAAILGVARAVGETAPLIMTSFGSSLMNLNPFVGSAGEPPALRLLADPQPAAEPDRSRVDGGTRPDRPRARAVHARARPRADASVKPAETARLAQG